MLSSGSLTSSSPVANAAAVGSPET